MRDHYEALTALGVEVVGVSFDSVEENRAFAEKNKFPFLLLSDADRSAALLFGAVKDKDAKWASRVSFVIGEDQKVLYAYDKVSPATHLERVLKDLQAEGKSVVPKSP